MGMSGGYVGVGVCAAAVVCVFVTAPWWLLDAEYLETTQVGCALLGAGVYAHMWVEKELDVGTQIDQRLHASICLEGGCSDCGWVGVCLF